MAIGWRSQYQRYRGFYLNILSLYKQKADIRAFLEIILSISTIIIFLLFALKPTALTIIGLYSEIQEKQKTVAVLNQKINSLSTAGSLLTQNKNSIPDINFAVSDLPRPDLISGQIEALAAKNSVTILGISVEQVTVVGSDQTKKTTSLAPLPDNANGMALSVSVKGDYPNLVSLLKDIENLRMVTKLDITGISSSVTEKGKSIVAIISGRVPYLGQ